jgi:hypothetical protein
LERWQCKAYDAPAYSELTSVFTIVPSQVADSQSFQPTLQPQPGAVWNKLTEDKVKIAMLAEADEFSKGLPEV